MAQGIGISARLMLKVPRNTGTGLSMFSRLIASAIAACLLSMPLATPLQAGMVLRFEPDPAQTAALTAFLRNELPDLRPWTEEAGTSAFCGENAAEPRLRALLMGLNYRGTERELAGSLHDLELMQATFAARDGIVLENTVIAGRADRQEAFDAMTALINCVSRDDQVVFYFAGLSYQAEGPAVSEDAMAAACEQAGVAAELQGQCLEWVRGALFGKGPSGLRDLRDHLEGTSGTRLILDVSADGSQVTHSLRGDDLANFALAVRKRGASIFFIFDGCYAGGLSLGTRQNKLLQWHAEAGETGLEASWFELASGRLGEFAAFYAVGSDGLALEKQLGDRVHGLFTFSLAKVLQAEQRPTVQHIAELLSEEMRSFRDVASVFSWPVFEATRPDMALLAAELPATAGIEIESPVATRGAFFARGEIVELRGRLAAAADIVIIDGKEIALDSAGRFTHAVELNGRTRIDATIISRGRVLTQPLTFTFEGDVEAALAQGRRYALVIGNQNYLNPGFSTLRTPIDDAVAVATQLRDRYGFETSLTVDDRSFELVVTDATRDTMHRTLNRLANVLTPLDSLLIYYAGHGVWSEAEQRGYWVPIDGEADFLGSLFSSDDLRAYLARIPARKVLVVSDSCYAGSLARSAGTALPLQEGRRLALVENSQLKSRVFLAAGGQHPVWDGGGSGHSIFAAALLNGLEQMEQDAFSAQELFTGYLAPLVARADQRPLWQAFDQDAGHEEGDFVFARAGVDLLAPNS
jgi:uncharacterized caspase-like protein